MGTDERPSVSVCRRGSGDPGSDPLRIVVWVRGEHDPATRVHLSATIAQAGRLDDADMVVDLSGVTFMDASTIGAFVDAYNRLRARSRRLSLRAPSPLARRLLDVCRLAFLIEGVPAPARPAAAPALDSWIAVPGAERTSGSARPQDARRAPSREPVGTTAPNPARATESVPQRRTPP